ncbi:MAG: cytochrome c biogenesis protein CcdA [Spirochaetaceae bacterium]|nr:MAG: cytochrome c biogenesis protein CcdA [Spirochaetaceae bacterium]
MSGDVSVLIAFVAGLLSFLSPCVLPLIPSYLSFVSGLSFQDLSRGSGDRVKILGRTAFFVLGFSIVFVALGILFAGPALLFTSALTWMNLAAGLVVVLLGLNITFDFVSFLNRERRIHVRSRPAGALGAMTVGMAFGAGWSPCIGPILASILFLAGAEGHIARAGLLLLSYSLGLGIPFLATGLAFTRVTAYLNRIKPHLGRIRVVSGLFLVGIGLLIAFGRFQQINAVILSSGYRLQQWSSTNREASRILFSLLLLILAAFHPASRLLRGLAPLKPVGSSIALVLLIAGILQWTGVLDLGVMLSRWLMYQGI